MNKIWYSKSHHFYKDLRCCNKAQVGDITLLMPISLFLKNIVIFRYYVVAHQIIIFFTITIFLFLFHIAACINANTHVNNLIGTSSTMVDQWLIDVTQGTAFPPVSSPPSGFY